MAGDLRLRGLNNTSFALRGLCSFLAAAPEFSNSAAIPVACRLTMKVRRRPLWKTVVLSRSLTAISIFLAVSIAPRIGHSFERQLQLGVDLFYAQFFDPVDTETILAVHGGGLAGRARWGVSDALAIDGQVSWAGHSLPLQSGDTLLRQAATAAVGLRWAIDVFELVPSLAVLVGGHFVFQDTIVAPAFLLDLQGALDWDVREDLAIGVGFAYQMSFGSFGVPNRLLVSVRFSWQHVIARRLVTDE